MELESVTWSECGLVNPWCGAPVDLHRDGRRAETLAGGLLTFATRAGERVVFVRSGATPEPRALTNLG